MKNEAKELESTALCRNRRDFLKLSGLAIAGTGLLLAGCNDDDDDGGNNTPDNQQLPGMRNNVFDFGGGDLGILTYAYALEQLEAEFATRVVTAPGFTTTFPLAVEQQAMLEIYNHEVIHRELFRNLLTSLLPNHETQLLPDLEFDFGNLNFADRAAVLTRAATFEDIGIAAYNGSGRYITNPDNLVLAGKIVSVEGRHASVIRHMMNPNTPDFTPTPLDPARLPSQIIAEVRPYIQTDFTATFLP